MTDTPEITAIRAAMRLFESASNTAEIEDALDAFELASGPEEMARLIKHIDAQHAEIARLKAEVTRPESTEMTLMRTLVQSRGLEIERLRADKARLDWFEQHHETVLACGKYWYSRSSYGMPMKRRSGFRSALDAAMKETP
jgi:uncharacterized small protein (DUF1192 family)